MRETRSEITGATVAFAGVGVGVVVGMLLWGGAGVSLGAQFQAPHGVAVAPGGSTVRIDAWTCFGSSPITAGQPPASHPCPARVEFGEDLRPETLVCRSTKTGQTCQTLGKLFPEK
jgi:hypothetical protein